jgi:hypothetical protein
MGGLFYQAEGAHIVDYQLYQLPGCREYLRGPQMVLKPRHFVVFVGAAQTFGTFCRYPFPSLAVERVGLAGANFGIGGAGPETFLLDPVLMDVINNARVAVVQVMSGRSAPNRLYETARGTSSLRRRDRPGDKFVWAESVWDEILKEFPKDEVAALIEDTRNNWVRLMQELLDAIKIPKILLWVSTRKPDFNFDLSSRKTALGPFPHFVNLRMVDALRRRVDAYVDATSSRGTPQPLFNRFTGELASIYRPEGGFRYNSGYPSPEMHVDIAEALVPTLKKWGSPKDYIRDESATEFVGRQIRVGV